jgi:bacteriorhodopsin
MAIWSLVLSIISLGGAGSVAGILLGATARRRISVTGERGHGLAIAGIILGVVTLVLWIGYWAVLAMHTGGSGGGSGGGGGY